MAQRIMINPYAPPSEPTQAPDVANERLNAVGRIFGWIGFLGSLIYVPILIGCIAALIASLAGTPISKSASTPSEIAMAAVINVAVLSLWLSFLRASREVKQRRFRARSRVLVLSVFMIFIFPILTIPGIFCLRWVWRYFREQASETVDR